MNLKLQGHRKFVVACTSLTMGFVLALMQLLSGGQFVTLVTAVLALFGGYNLGEHFANSGNGDTKPNGPQPVD